MKKFIITMILLMSLAFPAFAQVLMGDCGPTTFVVPGGYWVLKDTLYSTEWYGRYGSKSLVGMWVYCAYTTDLAAPMFEACQILKSATVMPEGGPGTNDTGIEWIAIDTASSASIGFSANATAGDVFYIMRTPPENAKIRGTVTATKLATGVTTRDGLLYVNNIADSLRSELTTTTGIATFPTGVFHANGVSLAEASAWTQDTLRKVGTSTDSILAYLHSATGAPAATGAFPAAGLSLLERIQFLADSLRKVATSTDTTLAYLSSATGAPAVTGTFPAAGVSVLERIGFLCDSLRKVGTSTDSVWAYLATATGAVWGTATEPANGVNLFEGVGFMQNQVDTVAGKLYGAVGSQWAEAAATYAAGVSHEQVLASVQDLLDSNAVYLFAAGGITAYPAAEQYANGVPMAAVVAMNQDLLDTIRSETWGASGIAVFPAAEQYANGVPIAAVVGSIQDLLDTAAVHMEGAGGIAAFPAAEAPGNGVPLAAVVRFNYDLGLGVRDSLEDANDLLQKFNGVTTGYVDENIWTTVRTVVDFAAAGAWEETASTHEVFNVTGSVEFEITAFCSTDVGSTSADSLWMFLGEAGATGYRAFSFLAEDADAGENLIPTVHAPGYIWTAAGLTTFAGGVWKGTINMGKDIGYAIDNADFTGGIIVFYCRWRPITTGSTVVAGAGAAL